MPCVCGDGVCLPLRPSFTSQLIGHTRRDFSPKGLSEHQPQYGPTASKTELKGDSSVYHLIPPTSPISLWGDPGACALGEEPSQADPPGPLSRAAPAATRVLGAEWGRGPSGRAPVTLARGDGRRGVSAPALRTSAARGPPGRHSTSSAPGWG